MIHGSDPTTPMPAPPWDIGRARNAGSQKNRPQFANCTAEPRAMMSSVRPIKSGRKITENGLGPLVFFGLRTHVSGSWTWRRIHSVKNAGTTPTTKSHRHASAPREGEPRIIAAEIEAIM